MCEVTINDLFSVYEQLKDRYPLTLTNTLCLNDGFAFDGPILVGHAHSRIIYLYEEYDGWFVLDILNADKTEGTHTHPLDISEAVDNIVEFMEGKSDYVLTPFPSNRLDFILDTDVGGDCDDMMALAYLVHAKQNFGVRIKAVTQCNACPGGGDLIRTFFENIGEPVPPIGSPVGKAINADNYCTKVLDRFGDGEIRSYPDAVTVLRRALVESENAVLCAIGPLNNIAALLESKGDDISPLDGVSLVREKCAKVVLMAGGFVKGEDGRNIPEWNALCDVAATQATVRLCPVPLVFLPFEAGLDMLTGGPLMDKYGDDTPLTFSFYLTGDTKDQGGRHSWDPATLLYAIEGCRHYFDESLRGTVIVDREGRTVMTDDPDGLHSILTIKPHNGMSEQQCKDQIAAYIDACSLKVHAQA